MSLSVNEALAQYAGVTVMESAEGYYIVTSEGRDVVSQALDNMAKSGWRLGIVQGAASIPTVRTMSETNVQAFHAYLVPMSSRTTLGTIRYLLFRTELATPEVSIAIPDVVLHQPTRTRMDKAEERAQRDLERAIEKLSKLFGG